MNLDLTDDQRAVAHAFETFFVKESSSERVRAAEASEPPGFDPRLWQGLVAMGVPAMGVPAGSGGGGAGLLDLLVVAEQAGRHLAPAPVVEASVAARALAGPAPPVGTEPLVSVLDGSAMATFCPRPVSNGRARLVPAGAVADLLVAFDGDQLLAVSRPRDADWPISPRNLGDGPLADWTLGTERSALGGRREFERAAAEWRVLTAGALVGLAQTALDLGVAYATTRYQYDVPIGSFQAIQHRLADVATAVEGARLLAYEAAWATDEHLAESAAPASMAFVFAAETAQEAAAVSLHVHGGYGFMLEYDIQLYFRRAKAWPLAAGDPRREYQRLADQLWSTQ